MYTKKFPIGISTLFPVCRRFANSELGLLKSSFVRECITDKVSRFLE